MVKKTNRITKRKKLSKKYKTRRNRVVKKKLSKKFTLLSVKRGGVKNLYDIPQLNEDVIGIIKENVLSVPSINNNELNQSNYKKILRNNLLKVCKYKIVDRSQREKKRQALINLYKSKLIIDLGDKDNYDNKKFNLIVEELIEFIEVSDTKNIIEKILNYVLINDEIIEEYEDNCGGYDNDSEKLECIIGEDGIFEYLKYKEIISIIDYMLELSIRLDNLPEVCNNLYKELS